jgi:hypothetical protein
MAVTIYNPDQPATEKGNMGLRGLWAQVSNYTSMVAVTVMAFLFLFQLQRMHEETVQLLAGVVAKNTQAIENFVSEIRKNPHP